MDMVAVNSPTNQTERIDLGRLWWASLLAGLAAAAANSVVYLVASAAGAILPTVLVPGVDQPVTLAPVTLNSFLPAIVAGVLLALLNRFTNRPVRNFRIIAAVVLLISLVSPFTIPGAPIAMS